MDLLDEQAREQEITEISARMKLYKSPVHSLLKTLQLHVTSIMTWKQNSIIED
ncbi:helix-turn-helix domain-containing protein [Paenibacillus agricola]|uniref:helix-turn-helix domain-containing protein n=1 Tax=Paenibacillus agricola TaxID=2716264 RepID=UPI001FB5D35E|nr:helix-turn-helix domain-containing protein [Paenibacillus agricola]